MCGIIAYVGAENCASILVSGLRRLEYRGYDSAGLAVQDGSRIHLVRAVGKLGELEKVVTSDPIPGRTGIGHTRWATHGRPNEVNAHPHVVGPIAVVHNGIIENHAALRRQLEERGARFASETDTEVIAQLVAEALSADPTRDLEAAVRITLGKIEGSYALAVVSRHEPGKIIVAKHDSPLVLGFSADATLAASDVPALLGRVDTVAFLEDGDVAVLTDRGVTVTDVAGAPLTREVRKVEWSLEDAEKGGFTHFMEKEIHDQPRAISAVMRGRINAGSAAIELPELDGLPVSASWPKRVYFTGCGTSANATRVGRYWIEELAQVSSIVEIASELRSREPILGPDDLVVAVSQSGETADTLAAVRTARARGAQVLAVTNVVGSALARAANASLYTNAGPEIGVASTKCFTTQLAAMLMFSVWLGRKRDVLSDERAARIVSGLRRAPGQVSELLATAKIVEAVSRRIRTARDVLFLGRGVQCPIALEGALKLKEISYVHAEGYAAGEMKHGPLALVDREVPVIVLCPRDRHRDKTLSNLQEARARGGRIIAVATAGDREVAEVAESVIEIPEADEAVLPLLTVIPLQFLSYFSALERGCDVDQPRNLAKTVTVE